MKHFPSIDAMKEAVRRAMCVLKAVSDKGKEGGQLNESEQALATTCIIGILALNGFFGRKYEWEVMEDT